MFENMAYIPRFTETYEHELSAIETAAEQATAYVARETAKLTRADGTPVFGPAEHRERMAAILEAAGAQFDAATRRHVEASEQTVADLEKRLSLLAGDPLDALSVEDQARAAARRDFVREDVDRLPAYEVANRVRAAIAGGDKVLSVLYARYLPSRQDLSTPPLRDVSRELSTFLGADERRHKRGELEERIRAARALQVAVDRARRSVNGPQDIATGQRAVARL